MGVADVVPGVSGGTVALLTGIYPRLIAALSAFDFRALRLLRTGQFTTLARTVDLRFLIALGAGVGVGLITTLLTVVKLLGNDTSRPWVLASFLGMLLAAAWIMLRTMLASAQQLPGGTRYHPGHWGWSAVGLSVALAISLMQQGSGVATPSFGYIFLCGIIGISAMILPGISGAMLLLLLGGLWIPGAHPSGIVEGRAHWGQLDVPDPVWRRVCDRTIDNDQGPEVVIGALASPSHLLSVWAYDWGIALPLAISNQPNALPTQAVATDLRKPRFSS